MKRSITCLSWHPDGGKRLATAFSCLEFQKTSTDMSLDSYVWDIGGSEGETDLWGGQTDSSGGCETNASIVRLTSWGVRHTAQVSRALCSREPQPT